MLAPCVEQDIEVFFEPETGLRIHYGNIILGLGEVDLDTVNYITDEESTDSEASAE